MDRPPAPPPSASGTVVILTAVLAAACAIFLFLAVLLGPVLIELILIGLAFAVFGGFHYWFWGRSMPPREPDERTN